MDRPRAHGPRKRNRPPEASDGRLSFELDQASSLRISRISSAVSDGVLPTFTPAASSASFFAAAVPDEPDTMAPAWPMVLPSGAVKPATYPTTGLVTCSLM